MSPTPSLARGSFCCGKWRNQRARTASAVPYWRTKIMRLAFLIATALTAFGQSSVPQVFEAADVHVSAPNASGDGGFLPGGRIEFRGVTLLLLISVAYSVPPEQVDGGPSWIDTDKFDVTAAGPAGASSAIALRSMLQNLLTDRFGLA